MPISVIIPAKNEASGIAKLIHHIKSSAFTSNFGEIIVIDGNSSDETVNEAKQAGATVYIAPIPGRPTQMNFGATKASFESLLFLHADTFLPQQWDFIIQKALSNPESEAGCFRLEFDDPHPLLKLYASFTRFDLRFVRFGDQGLFIKKKLFNQLNGFKNDHIVMEDNEIVYRIKKHTQFVLLPNPVITSARKYRDNGVIRLQLIFGLIYYGYFLGISQNVLVDLYKKLIKM